MRIFQKEWRWESAPLGQPWQSIGLMCVSIFLGYWATYFYIDTNKFLDNAISITGTVINHAKTKDDRYAAIIEFEDDNGKIQTFRSKGFTSHPDPRVGTTLPVLFNSNSIETARINSFVNIWIVTLILGGMSVAFFVGSILVWVYRRALYSMAGYPELSGSNKSLNSE